MINEHLKIMMTEADIFAVLAKSQEFEQIKVLGLVCPFHLCFRLNITFVEIGLEMISTAILSLSLIQVEQLSVTGERMCTLYWLTP